jgi:hypothetical protein
MSILRQTREIGYKTMMTIFTTPKEGLEGKGVPWRVLQRMLWGTFSCGDMILTLTPRSGCVGRMGCYRYSPTYTMITMLDNT